jgi:FtsP/CotA-like multicopper oxidase with cupredoxin domain
MGRIDEVVATDTTEVWEAVNQHTQPHNFHVHGVQFQLLDLGGRPHRRRWPAGRTPCTCRHGSRSA